MTQKKIESLTAEQLAKLDEIADKWINLALGGDDSYDLEEIRKGVEWLYRTSDLEPPAEIVVCGSPRDMSKKAELGPGDTYDYLGIGYDAHWVAWAEAAQEVGVEFDPEWGFDTWHRFLEKGGVWATVLFEKIAYVCVRPCRVCRTSEGQLHSEDGPAIAWNDGFQLYFLNGVEVSKELVMTPAAELDPHILLKEKNVEIRREIVRKIGMDTIVAKLGAETVDRDGDYELILFELGDGRKRPFLKMLNPSLPGVWHVEGVPPEIQNVKAALAWRNGRQGSPRVLT